jgi:hypothetical protein
MYPRVRLLKIHGDEGMLNVQSKAATALIGHGVVLQPH